MGFKHAPDSLRAWFLWHAVKSYFSLTSQSLPACSPVHTCRVITAELALSFQIILYLKPSPVYFKVLKLWDFILIICRYFEIWAIISIKLYISFVYQLISLLILPASEPIHHMLLLKIIGCAKVVKNFIPASFLTLFLLMIIMGIREYYQNTITWHSKMQELCWQPQVRFRKV